MIPLLRSSIDKNENIFAANKHRETVGGDVDS